MIAGGIATGKSVFGDAEMARRLGISAKQLRACLCLVKTSSGRVSRVRIVAAWDSDPGERLHDELDGEVGKHERNGDKRGDRHDGPEGEGYL